jgi:hypothetical protein
VGRGFVFDPSALRDRSAHVPEPFPAETLEAAIRRVLNQVLIRGDGVAAFCCARLLRNAGFRVAVERPERPWGKDAEAIPVPHSATVVTEAILLDDLATGFEPDPPASPDFIIHASKPLPASTEEHRFGSRTAVATEVNLKDKADVSSCWIESLADGWLFLIPNASGSTWLLGIGAPLEPLLASSRVIAPRIELLDVRFGEFPACPRMDAPICGEGWIACGTAAMGFDPMCGDGAGSQGSYPVG